MILSTAEVPSMVELDPVAGASAVHRLDDLKQRRPQEVAFRVARVVLDSYLMDDEGNPRPWLFPDVLAITNQWLAHHLRCKDGTFPQMLLLTEWTYAAATKIYQSIVLGTKGETRLLPLLQPYEPIGSTSRVAFDTTKEVYATDPDKCHLNYVVSDTHNWEQKMAQALESMPEVLSYVKNERLGLAIPYVHDGRGASYLPDFIVKLDDGQGEPLNLIVEVSGMPKKEKRTKAWTATNQWIPAVNNNGEFGRWAYVEIRDPWDAQNVIRAKFLSKQKAGA
jgi:type III restriction enzyme